MDPNSMQYHLLDALKFLIWATAIMFVAYLAGTFLYDKHLRKKAWLARQKTGAARLEWLLLKRKIR